MKITYYSNNSGGGWWLKDDDWKNLEKAGWSVSWVKDIKSRIFTSETDRFLEALATGASKEFDSVKEALLEFEKITGQDVSDEGCNCCGAPHSFEWEENGKHCYCFGEECLEFLYPDKNTNLTKRQALDLLQPTTKEREE